MLLEPMMAVEVVTPAEFMGDVMGDLNSRRGHVEGMEPRGNGQVIGATVPLSTMFGYATDLRSMTQGRATYTMQFKHYAEVPPSDRRRDRRQGQGSVDAGGSELPLSRSDCVYCQPLVRAVSSSTTADRLSRARVTTPSGVGTKE